jgi:glycyl-tRNA synthetase
MTIIMMNSYFEDVEKDRVVMKLPKVISPVKAAVFPLLGNKEELVNKAKEVYTLLSEKIVVDWDDRGNIGKRYYAQDEIGTPFCITVDFQTLEDNTVTVRDRDTATQTRVKLDNIFETLQY